MKTQTYQLTSDPFSQDVMNNFNIDTPVYREEDSRERYFFFAGDSPGFPAPGGMSIATECIPYQQIRRCQVTPLITTTRRMRKWEIPEGRLVPGSIFGDHAQMRMYAGPESERILYDYGNKQDEARNWGLVEFDMLRGWPLTRVASLKLTEVMFPNYPIIPETNEEVLLHLHKRRDQLMDDYEPGEVEFYQGICDKMIEAVEAAHRYQQRIMDASNSNIERAAGDIERKEKFDNRDYLFAKRAQIQLSSRRPTVQAPSTDPMFIGQLLEKISNSQPQTSIETIVAAVTAAMQSQSALTPDAIASAVMAGIKHANIGERRKVRGRKAKTKVASSQPRESLQDAA